MSFQDSKKEGNVGLGRNKIITNKELTPDTILDILNEAWNKHIENVKAFDYLINYYKGQQDILNREPSYTSGINNKVTLNYANSSVRDIVGYTFGKPIQITQRKGNKKDIKKIVDILEYENSSTIDNEVATDCAITGLGYFCTLPTSELLSDFMPDVPLKTISLNVKNTFVVHSSKLGNPVILSCTYYTENKNTIFLCFTDDYIFKIKCKGENIYNKNSMKIEEFDINPIGLNPINLVQNNKFMMGDFEVAISVLNALNQIASDSVNDIENVIKGLLVIINAELNEDNTEKLKSNRILELVAGEGKEPDAKFIYQQLDSMGVGNLREYFEEAYKIIIGIPDRKTRGGGGGDTGDAVKLRDGWADIEVVARIKESYFRIAKKKQLAIVISILQKLGYISESTKLINLDISFPRNKNDNLQTKAQSYSTIISTKTIAPEDALEMADMTTDVAEVIARGEEYWSKKESEDNNIQTDKNTNNSNNQVEDKTETQIVTDNK